MKHSKEYVIHYIQRHLSKKHSLHAIIEHLKAHNVDKDTLYEALKEIKIGDDQKVEIKEQNQDDPNFFEELNATDYLITAALFGIFVISLFTSFVTTLFLLVTALCIGFSYAGSKNWPIQILVVQAVIGFFVLLYFDTMLHAIFFTIVQAIIIGALYRQEKKLAK